MRVVESSTDITERKLIEQRLTTQVARLDLLNHVTRAIGDRQDLPSIYGVVLRTLEEQLPIAFGCVFHYDAPQKLLRLVNIGPNSQAMAQALGLTGESSICIDQNGLSRCVAGDLVYEPETGLVPFAFPMHLGACGLGAMVAAPLQVESQVFGVLIAARHEANSFSSGECEFLKQLSEHVALAAHQAQLYGALQTAYDDLQQTQQAVSQQERLRVMGQMASGIAHDINNALTPASLYTQLLLEEKVGLAGESRQQLVIVQRAIDDVAQSVARMKEFYRPRDPHNTHAPVNLNRTIEQVIDLTRSRWKTMPQEHGIVVQVEADLEPGLASVMGSDAEIRDALMNIVLNAVDSMPDGGRIILRSRATERNQVSVEVIDTGIGMDEATRSRCLEPFFTTKGERGSGLGLAMVYGMMERHGGSIQVRSELGRGTRIEISFPTNLDTGSAAGGDAAGIPLRCRPLRLLLIDDDVILSKSLSDALRRDGHAITVADGGPQGIESFRAAQQRDEQFDLVITDLGMPKLDGRSVAIAIKALAADTPIILLTGWGHRLIAEQDMPRGVDRVLSKPPKLEVLRAVLCELAGSAR
jgi:signal transduction histidine kinase/ActR/RegA family two-component response regulator